MANYNNKIRAFSSIMQQKQFNQIQALKAAKLETIDRDK